MEYQNYTHKVIESIEKREGSLNALTDNVADELINRLNHGVKFRLPVNGFIFGTREFGKSLSDLIKPYVNEINLPYPVTVLEYYLDNTSRSIFEGATETFDAIVIIFHDKTTHIDAVIFYRDRKTKNWEITNFGFSLDKIEMAILPKFYTPIAERLFHKDQGYFINDIKGELSTLIEFLACLNCSNVKSIDVHPPEKLNKHRKRKGKQPLSSYKILTVPGVQTSNTSLGGTHASPRTHLRRGHIRRLRNGTRIWINAVVVNKDVTHGVVHKDYNVKI